MQKARIKAHQKLLSAGIRPSVQRIAILEHLMNCYTHPTVDDVYKQLHKQISTLSKTTVYNTLRMFAEAKIINMITIDDHRVCYDGITEQHAHFFCTHCECIVDLPYDHKQPKLEQPLAIQGHQINDVQLYYKGTCAACLKTPKQ